MIIDFHTHIFPDRIASGAIHSLEKASEMKAYTDGTLLAERSSMEKAGVDLSINLPVLTNPAQADKVNDSLMKSASTLYEQGILTFGGMHPLYENYREKLRSLKENGIKGIKLHPAYQRVDLNDLRNMNIIDCASELGLLVLVHAGDDIGIPEHNYADIRMVLDVIDTLRPPALVLAHMGGWNGWDDVRRYVCGAPVWFDTAFSIGEIPPLPHPDHPEKEGKVRFNMSDEAFLSLVKAHGADRVLFGTDLPWADQKEYVERISKMPFTEGEKARIFGENAKALLGL